MDTPIKQCKEGRNVRQKKKERKKDNSFYCYHNEVVQHILVKPGNQFLTKSVDILTKDFSFLVVFLSSPKVLGQYLKTVTNTSSHILSTIHKALLNILKKSNTSESI
jgi:hypothetical protein